MAPLIQHLGIVGVGLIGGSIGAAARKRRIAGKVTGWGRSAAKLGEAVTQGILDEATDHWGQLDDCDFVVVATPVDRIVQDVVTLAEHCRAKTIVTDAGSVKGSICDSLATEGRIRFVGAHPLAGSEKAGFAHADPELFQGRVCVITPENHTDASAAEIVQTFWERLGMRVLAMSPDEHDRRLARTSHLPHLTAAALCHLLELDDRPVTATGFRDTTRIAAGDPDLWRAIFEANAEAVIAETDRLIELLTRWRDRIAKHDWRGLTEGLQFAKAARDAIRDLDRTGQ